MSGTSLTAQIPPSDLTAVSTASVTAVSPAPGGGTSAGLTFAVNPPSTYVDLLDVEGSDLAWNPIQKQLYGRCRLLRAAMQARSQIQKDLLGGMVVLDHTGTVYQRGAAEKAEKLLYSRYGGDSLRTQKTPLTFIPYYAGANRQATSMQVWSLLLQS